MNREKKIIIAAIIMVTVCYCAFYLLSNSHSSTQSTQEPYKSLSVILNGEEVYQYNGKCNYTLYYDGKHIEVYNDIGTLYEAYSDNYFTIVTETLETDDNP